jgi:hypothetical protein
MMGLKDQVSGLNEFLTKVYGQETRLSSLLADLGFNLEQVEIIRSRYLGQIIGEFLECVRTKIGAGWDGENLWAVLSRRYGLDGEPPDSRETIARHLQLSPERTGQIEEAALAKCRTKTNRQLFRNFLHKATLKLVRDATENPDPEDIVSKLNRLAELRIAAGQTRSDHENKRAEILKQVHGALESLDAEFEPLLKVNSEEIQRLEAEIKNDVLRHGRSIHSEQLYAVYSRRLSWDSKGLSQYAETHPELLRYRREGNPTVSIRVVNRRPAETEPFARTSSEPERSEGPSIEDGVTEDRRME